jgi:hypothetical protein
MDQVAQLALIDTYLADETKMYQDWYKGLQQGQAESKMIPFAEEPSNDSIIKRFKNWLNKNKDLLKQKICIGWNYLAKKNDFKAKKFLIAAIADILALLGIPTATATATWLEVKGHLNKLCEECVKESD